MFAGSSIAAASSSRLEPSEPIPSIEEFIAWLPEQVAHFFEPYLKGFSRDQRDLFIKAQYDGETMETMSRREYAEVGLVDGVCRKIAMVVNKIREARSSNLKRRTDEETEEELRPPKRHQREHVMIDELNEAMEGVTTPAKQTHGINEFLIKRADKLAGDIKAVSYNLMDYSTFGDELLQLPFPFLGKPPISRFPMVSTSSAGASGSASGGGATDIGHEDGPRSAWFRYYGREAFKAIYDDVMSLRMYEHYSLYYIHGTLGYGKSYILAALAIVLIQERKKVVYLPDCRGLVRSFRTYLRRALMLTYAGDQETQSEVLRCATAQALVDWCIRQAELVGDELYFIIDQINALDTDPESLDSVSIQDRQQCARHIADLEGSHFLIFSSSGNYKHGFNERNGSPTLRKSFFGGLSETEMRKWWAVVGPTICIQVSNAHRETAENLTGKVPIFLQDLAEIKAVDPVSVSKFDDDERWERLMEKFLESELVTTTRQNIGRFYSQTRRRLESTHNGSWRLYLETCQASVSGSPIPVVNEPLLLDWRYYFHQNGIGNSTCLLVRQYLTNCMRNDVYMTEFQTNGWRSAMAAAGPDNPSVLGFFTEQVLLGEIARSGLSALGTGWEEKMTFQAFSTRIPNMPREAKRCGVMYVPSKPNFKGIDALLFKLVSNPGKRGKYKAIVVPAQITIAESHSDSEAAFFSTWSEYELQLRSLDFISSIEIIFLWIVEQVPAGRQPEEAEPKGTRTLRGNSTNHPDFVRRWMTVDEASLAVGDLLKAARGRPTVANIPILMSAGSPPKQTPAAPAGIGPAPGSSPSPPPPVVDRRSTRAAARVRPMPPSAPAIAINSPPAHTRRRKAKK